MDERRKYLRAPLQVEMFCGDLASGINRGKGVICFYSTDISVGGLFLETDIPFEEGHMIHMKFSLPGMSNEMQLQGRVVRNASRPPHAIPGMAIEFLQLGFEERKAIEGFVEASARTSEKSLD